VSTDTTQEGGDLLVTSPSTLVWRGKTYPCLIGKGGFATNKREGDGATPVGNFAIRLLYWRADRLALPETPIPSKALSPTDGWCDDPAHPLYNQFVSLPFDARHEELWREDSAYDIIGVLGYNDAPPISGRGSAIFLHVWREGASHTEGCVALKVEDLMAIIPELSKNTTLVVQPG
jgi:L,D-peptidoglycan transpeptidase YkuD (ErfK/YbiS/YcfS/YnhG family)